MAVNHNDLESASEVSTMVVPLLNIHETPKTLRLEMTSAPPGPSVGSATIPVIS